MQLAVKWMETRRGSTDSRYLMYSARQIFLLHLYIPSSIHANSGQ